ncbi:MAG: pyridoxamine 5'-phosphate oxidase family protein [Actinobacteria bacterium]|nr:pyridoxamine 5'-phosphate oxidase family protein [Actinomycetota bacterium]
MTSTGADAAALARSAARAALAEVAWRAPDGRVRCEALTPLVAGDRPVFALPYARLGLASELEAAGAAAIVLSDSRLARRGWTPLGATVSLSVTADPQGERFADELMDQELRKHPPSRALIDSLLLRREHWWYLPRLLVETGRVARVRPVGRRSGPDEAVLAYATGGTVDADTVAVRDWDEPRVRLRSLAGRDPDAVGEAPATLFSHDFTVPDLDARSVRFAEGRLVGGRLHVERRGGRPLVGGPPGLLARLRALRDLRRACVRGLGSAP